MGSTMTSSSDLHASRCGFTDAQWERLPRYVKDEIATLHHTIDKINKECDRLKGQAVPTRMWQGWGDILGDTPVFIEETTVHFGNNPGDSLFQVAPLLEEQQIQVYGVGAIVVEPRASNHVIISLR